MANREYMLTVVAEFSAAHILRDYPGPCSRMHGHNWKVEVEVASTELDELGMGMDFREIRRLTGEVVADLDHRYLNEIAPFDEVNPTAENVAAYFYSRLDGRIAAAANGRDLRLQTVTIWENDRCRVRYRER